MRNKASMLSIVSTNRIWKDIQGIWDLTKIQCRVRENTKFFHDRIWDLISTREVGFTKILAWDAVLGKKTVFRIEMTEVQVVGLW